MPFSASTDVNQQGAFERNGWLLTLTLVGEPGDPIFAPVTREQVRALMPFGVSPRCSGWVAAVASINDGSGPATLISLKESSGGSSAADTLGIEIRAWVDDEGRYLGIISLCQDGMDARGFRRWFPHVDSEVAEAAILAVDFLLDNLVTHGRPLTPECSPIRGARRPRAGA